MFQTKICLGDRCCRKGVSRQDIGTRFDVAGMHFLNDMRLRQIQHIVIALDGAFVIAKPVAAVIFFGQGVALECSAVRTVQDQNTFSHLPLQRVIDVD